MRKGGSCRQNNYGCSRPSNRFLSRVACGKEARSGALGQRRTTPPVVQPKPFAGVKSAQFQCFIGAIMKATEPASPAFRFHLNLGKRGVDCVVTDDAIEALGASPSTLTARHRRFLEGIAAERVEWSLRPQSTITIDAWDIATHRQD